MSSKSKAPKNISVFVRVRPPVPREKEHTFNNITYNPADDRIISILKPNASKPTPAKEYVFNRVFKPSSTQKQVYEEFGKNAVDAAFSGEHGVLFVYGQTGSGKTFTISNDDPQDPGVLQQALTEVWDRIARESKDYDFICSVSYVQLYNEILTNLLDEKRGRVRIQLGQEGAGDVVLLSEANGSPVEVAVRSYEDSMNLFHSGMKRKEMTSTAMNATSSRSHTIFTFNILKSTRNGPRKVPPMAGATDATSKDNDAKSSTVGNDVLDSARGGSKSTGGATARGAAGAAGNNFEPDSQGPSKMALEGRLVLCDLAGSERISKTLAQGKALDEATHINGSLLVLGKVVAALIEKKSQHAPFRESKLTRILQYSLLGNGNTSLVVNVSPSDDNTDETLSAMFFGQRASQIKQDAKRHEILDYKALYLQLLADIDMKRDNLLTHVVDEEAALYDSRIEELEQELAMCKLEIATLRKENEVARGGITTEQLRVLYYDSGVEWKAMAKKIRGMYDALNERHQTLSKQHQKVALVCAESETQLFELGKRTQHMRMQYSVDFARFSARIDELTKQLTAAKGTEYISSEGDLAGASSPNWNTPQFPTIMSEESASVRLPTAITPREGGMFGASNTLPLEMQLVKEREQMSALRKEIMEMRLYQRKSVQAIRFLAAENESISSEVGKPCLYSKLAPTPSMTPREERPRPSTTRSSKSRK